MGSIVTKPLPGDPAGITPFLLIDGQQRLTTLTILLAAFRDAVQASHPTIAGRVQNAYLANQFVSDAATYKVLPTQADRAAYFAVIKGEPGDAASLVHRAYAFFRSVLDAPDHEGQPLAMDRLEATVLTGLDLVNISVDEKDNEYRIFESLNGKGERLTQSDLLRNYFFMRLPVAEHEAVYRDLWRPMQDALTNGQLDDFFRYEYMSEGQFTREDDVYQVWKDVLARLGPDDLQSKLRDFARDAAFYQRIVAPEREPDPAISRGLTRLNRWGGQTAYPFLLVLYRQHAAGSLDAAGFGQILRLIESYLVRRLFANISTQGLNRIFNRLPQQLPPDVDLVAGTRAALSEPGRLWPRDTDLRRVVLTYPLYRDSRPEQRKMILETLEESFEHREPVQLGSLQIEHVMPQTLSAGWIEALGPGAAEVHRKYLHVLGNLTLTGYNQVLSNSPFEIKRQELLKSNLSLNREIAAEETWGEDQILARGARLAERMIAIWPGPADDQPVVQHDTTPQSRSGSVPADQLQDQYLAYWTQFVEYLKERGSLLKLPKVTGHDWRPFALGRSEFGVYASHRPHQNRSLVDLYIGGPQAKSLFYQLRDQYKAQIEAQLGDVEWLELPKRQASIIRLAKPDLFTDRARWPDLIAWMADAVERMVATFRPIVKTLGPPEESP